jgi:hypothetical protein
MTLRREVDRLRHHVRRPLANTQYLWDAAMYVRSAKRATLARRDTALVMEGFLRSGNTFSVAAFIVANGPDLHIGRHLHGAQLVVRAVRLARPTVVLVRRPRDAVLSYLVRRPTLTPADGLMEYLDFYRTAWQARDGFVVGLFEEVIKDFGVVIARVNRRFGTAFASFDATAENQERAFALVEEMNKLECLGEVVETHVGRPSASRQQRKAELESLLEDPRAARLLQEADALYEQYAARAT